MLSMFNKLDVLSSSLFFSLQTVSNARSLNRVPDRTDADTNKAFSSPPFRVYKEGLNKRDLLSKRDCRRKEVDAVTTSAKAVKEKTTTSKVRIRRCFCIFILLTIRFVLST